MSLVADAIHFGFVTTVEIESLGLCGGMLLLNQVARPLEFHCTLPVKPTRSQQILYGASLRPFLCGQVIAKALLEKAKTKPHIIITDCLDTAELSHCSTVPMAFHSDAASPDTNTASAPWTEVDLNGQRVLLHANTRDQSKVIQNWLNAYTNQNELAEPFERIRQAIFEAHQVARQSA